jgi:TolB-like protein/DNA-binding winged helix-turn-helix (wHTH) protein
MNSRPQQRYEFGAFQLDISEHSLLRDGQVVPLEPKVFDLLRVLVQNDGRLLQKEELIREVWPDSFVEEGNLNRNIAILRKALGEVSSGKPYIETVPKRGYRFVASVRKIAGNGFGSTGIELTDQDAKVTDSELLQAGAKRDPGKGISSTRRWLLLGGGVVIAMAALVFILIRSGKDSTAPRIQSLAVLPLQNLSGDPAQEYFADGMTEALISSLAQIRALRVISRTSVMSFKGIQKPLPEIARELKAEGVVESSVQRENGLVKVTIQLIHAPSETHLWARNYERALTDVLKLQDEIARAIADEIRIQVTPEDRARMSAARAVNPAAHEAYLLGRFHFWKFIIDDHRRAIEHYERAIQIDPSYAPAYAGLSMAWQLLGLQGGVKGGVRSVDAQARGAAQKALELDDRLAASILERIESGGNFWTDIYEPYTRSDISRETVRLVIDKARARAGKTMPAVARHLKAVGNNGDSAGEQRLLFKFKNFLYKTVKIG